MAAISQPEIGLTAGFTDSLEQLSPQDQDQCWKALSQFAHDPSHQGLEMVAAEQGGDARSTLTAGVVTRV